MPSIGPFNSEYLLFGGINILIWTVSSKKSKVQSHGLAPAILEGLMPIVTEEEPEEADEDAPCRVSPLPFSLQAEFTPTLIIPVCFTYH